MSGRAPLLLAVMGPTGSGKSELAEAIAEERGARLISADAFQIYRGFDIGTNKPADVGRYALIDIRDPQESFGVGEFVPLASQELMQAHKGNQDVVLVGGTGFYIRALLEGFADLQGAPDPVVRAMLEQRERAEGLESLVAELQQRSPEIALRTDLKNGVRVRRALERILDPRPVVSVHFPQFQTIKVGLDPDRDQLKQRIAARLQKMVQNGWVCEVARLLASGVQVSDPAMRAIGYRAIADGVREGLALDAVLETVRAETVQYAKRQRSWLNSEPRLLRLQAFGGDALAQTRETIRGALDSGIF